MMSAVVAESGHEWALYGLDVLKVIAWPLVILVIVVVFRTEITSVLSRITKLSGLGFSAELARSAREIAEQLEDVEGREDLNEGDLAEEFQIIDPSMAVLRAWIGLEQVAADWSAALGRRRETPVQLARFLVQHELLSADTLEPIRRLQVLRNEIVHSGAQISQDAARSLIESIEFTSRLMAVAAEQLLAQSNSGEAPLQP